MDSKSIGWLDKEAFTRKSVEFAELEQNLKVPGLTILVKLGYALKIEPWKPGHPMPDQSGAWEAVVDLSAVKMPLTIRCRRPGDLIRPFGMNQPVKLKKYLHTHNGPTVKLMLGFPPLVIADDEEVIWIPGVGLSNKLKVTSLPSHSLSWIKLQDEAIYLV
ncbi:MAG: hypothetical protein HY711_05845 [Candidatus Melainabacteria bacterium]|nr:hypothetical protein [Candidatus Melainabacteria bacterium]